MANHPVGVHTIYIILLYHGMPASYDEMAINTSQKILKSYLKYCIQGEIRDMNTR